MTVNLDRLRAELQRRSRDVAVAMAAELKQVIIDNSKDSKDIAGHKLRKYTSAYAKWRKLHNLSTVPDLRVSGSMLDNQAFYTTSATGATLRPNPSDRAKAEGNQRYRKFYPETEDDLRGKTLKRLVKAGEAAFAA